METTTQDSEDEEEKESRSFIPKGPSQLESHPGIEIMLEWVNNGIARVDTEYIKTAKGLALALNQKYPQEPPISVMQMSRFKKRVMNQTGGYMLRGGEVCRTDGSPVEMIDPMTILKSFVQVGYEMLMKHPEKIQAKEWIIAMRLLKDTQGMQDANAAADVWKEFQKTRKRSRKPKVIDITPEDSLQNVYASNEDEE